MFKLTLFGLLLWISACDRKSVQEDASSPINQDASHSFQSLVDSYLQSYWQLYPSLALYAGLYDFDSQLAIPNQASREQGRQLTQQTLAALENFDEENLSTQDKTDRLILLNRLRYGAWSQDVLQEWRWDASNYNVAGGFGLILNTDYKPLLDRLDAFYRRMANVPAYYLAAQKNIANPTLPHLDLAIQQNRGAINLFKQQFLSAAEEAGVVQETLELYWVRTDEVVAAIENHIDYLQTLKTRLEADNSFRDFRLGNALFAEKFSRQIVTDFSADEVYELALAKKQALHQEMESITRALWPKYFPSTPMPEQSLQAIAVMITEVAKEHTTRENFVAEVRQQIAVLERFVLENDLLDLDPSRPLVVREMPEYERGFAVASIDAPGPFAARANTYYNVSPLDHYDDAGAESFLREYNNRTLQILNIHEAIPGHYAQLVHANNSASLIKSLFGNGAMIEGWAVYTEHMMLEAGYGNNEPELRLMYNKWLLRTVINAILDHDIHCNNLSEEDALAMMRNEGFQEEAEAAGKWRRATLSQIQLSSYFTGYSEILAFRESLRAELGEQFNLKDFHHQFLSYGNAPVPIIKQLMRETE
jgi:uncharacterized protein (DUF885 family)